MKAEEILAAVPRPNVLIVEDDPCMRQLMHLHLSNAGYRVTEAEDAVVAGHQLLKRTPDLLIVDVDLPYLSGVEFAAALLADATVPFVPLVFVTAHEELAAKAEALAADVLIKPFVKHKLLEVVARNIKRQGIPAAAGPAIAPAVRI